MRQERLEAIDRAARDTPGIVAAYLFGSAGRSATAPRDLDVALVFPEGSERRDRWRTTEAFARRLEADQPPPRLGVDAIDLAEAPPSLQLRILKEGSLAYESDPVARVRFVAKTLSMAIDFVEWQRPYLDRWLRSVAHGR